MKCVWQLMFENWWTYCGENGLELGLSVHAVADVIEGCSFSESIAAVVCSVIGTLLLVKIIIHLRTICPNNLIGEGLFIMYYSGSVVPYDQRW